jgi:aminoglycoside phosphotransferase (APT) family kinase protein
VDTQSLLSAPTGPGGVRATLGSAAVRRALRSALAGMLDDPSRLGPCRLQRTKCKPDTKLTAWYDVAVSATDGPRPVAVSWWAGDSLPPADPEGALAEADARERGCAAPFRTLRTRLPHFQMLVQVAPLDPSYRGLVSMSDPRHVASVLGYARPPRVVTLRYRPGQRHVLRYQPAVVGAGPTLFAKLYPDDRGRRLERSAAVLADVLDAGDDGTAARPAAYLAAERALVFAQVAGSPLSGLLGRSDQRTARGLRQAGAVLRRIHDADVALVRSAPQRPLTAEIAETERASAAISRLAPATGAAAAGVLERTRDVLAALPEEAPTLVHGDFKADHLLVGRRGLTLIDVDKCAIADPALDLAKFLADLRWWLTSDPAGAAAAQERFLDGYGPAPAARVARARALEPMFMVKLAARRVQVHQPRWTERTAGPIEHADRLLCGLSRA